MLPDIQIEEIMRDKPYLQCITKYIVIKKIKIIIL